MPSITRRRLVAGGTALAAVGGATLLPATYLPASLARARHTFGSVPEVSTRPPVTDGHVADAREWLASLVDRAERTWNRVDDPDAAVERLPGLVDPERSVRSARDYLDDARSRDGWDALFDVRRGADFAGRAVGGARLALGEASGEAMAARASEIQGDVADARERVTYEVGDPSVGLARCYHVEKWLVLARLNSYRSGTYVGQETPTTEYDDRAVVETWGSQMHARRELADAVRLYDDYRATVDGEVTDLTAHVERVEAAIRAAVREERPGYEESDRRQDALSDLPEPTRTFRGELLYYVRNTDVDTPEDLGAGVPLYRAVNNAETLLKARAARAVREGETLDEGESVTWTVLDRARREGMTLLRRHLDGVTDRPTLALLVEEGRRLLWAAGTEFEGGREDPHPKARAYATYRLATEYLRRVGDVTARLDRPGSA